MKTKKGDIWVSAVLYFGLGIIVISIILAAATPVINRLRDKNIILQTKDVFQVLDSNIREVAREGPGSQRPLTIDIRKGEFKIIDVMSSLEWVYPSKALIAQPGVIIQEGNLKIRADPGGSSATYLTKLTLDYTGLYIRYTSPILLISGNTPLVIRNTGVSCGLTNNYNLPVSVPPPPPRTASDACPCDTGYQETVPPSGCVVSAKPTVEIQQRGT